MDLEKARTDSKEVRSLGYPELAQRWKPLASVGHSLAWPCELGLKGDYGKATFGPCEVYSPGQELGDAGLRTWGF